MTGRTRACSDAIQTGRLEKATEFHDAAALVEDVSPNAAVEFFVLAGIAAADAICCKRLGVHAKGENHNEAVDLLEKADPGSAKYLRTLLSMKSKVAYTHQSVSKDDRKKASRAASSLVEEGTPDREAQDERLIRSEAGSSAGATARPRPASAPA